DSNASVVDNACVCKDGYFGIGYGENGCEVCPEGYICSGGEKKTKYIKEEITEQQSCPEDAKVSADGSSCVCKDEHYKFDADSNSCVLSSCKDGETFKDGKCVAECKAGSYRDSSGSCKECEFGTYTDTAEQTSCKKCPFGMVCPTTSAAISPDDCRKDMLKIFESNGSDSGILSKGIYIIEVAGAGGGGGGGIKSCGACSTSSYDSGAGGNGDLQTSEYLHVADSLSYTYTVGKGGDGSGRASCRSDGKYGDKGGTSSFESSLVTFVAEGGNGGRSVYGKATKCHEPGNTSSTGNGKGGAGGGRSTGKDGSGKTGSNGWVKIYQLNCNK
ncbi:hypothetical protein HDR60_04620, partial [bacterium]|nr:hypothetical protein [bacterium]